ncbi:MAG: hypothetical protein Q7R97_01235 [Candidatus Daviesbacteria bacterium]|nr:hypothetical protein [Candidatus Daviesbacteria bacterium]
MLNRGGDFVGTLITWVLNIFLGFFVTALLASQISSGQSISFENGMQLNLRLYNSGLIFYLIFIVIYFVGAKKIWGKTIGGLIASAILGKKSGKKK